MKQKILTSGCLLASIAISLLTSCNNKERTHLNYCPAIDRIHTEALADFRMEGATESAEYLQYGVSGTQPSFLEALHRQLTFPMAWRNSGYKNFEQWRSDARSVLFHCMGVQPSPAADGFAPVVVAKEPRDGYTAYKVLINMESYCRVPVYLLIPDGDGPFPGLLALHDHGAHFSIGKEKMIRPLACDTGRICDSKKNLTVIQDAIQWSVACYDTVFTGDYFAQNGYVVLATDALLWGERGRKEGPLYDTQQAMASNFYQLGTDWCGQILFDDMQSAAFLASLPFVDASRIGAYGHSMGCFRSWMLTAASDIVSASVNVCWMNTTAYLMSPTNNQNRGGSAYSMLLPGLRCYLDYPDVASISCPKPQFFMNGRYDKLFPVDGVEDAYKILHDVYSGQGFADNLKTAIYEEPHYFSREMQADALNFFNTNL